MHGSTLSIRGMGSSDADDYETRHTRHRLIRLDILPRDSGRSLFDLSFDFAVE